MRVELKDNYQEALQKLEKREVETISRYSAPLESDFVDFSAASLGLDKVEKDDIEQTENVEAELKANPVVVESVPRKLVDDTNISKSGFEVPIDFDGLGAGFSDFREKQEIKWHQVDPNAKVVNHLSARVRSYTKVVDGKYYVIIVKEFVNGDEVVSSEVIKDWSEVK